ncbi:MAG: hypothetical protein ACR2OU_11910 [Thermomicrobiales bacterium]
MAGQSTSEAAILAGVTRQTVSEWRNHNPEYRAARNAAAWDHMGDIAMEVRSKLLPLAFGDLANDLASEDLKVRQRARADLLRYERRLPEPPPADPDLESDAEAYRSFVAAFGGMQTDDEIPR